MPLPPSQSPQSQTNVATAADYADALFTARRARSVFAFAVIAMLLIQLAIFATYRFSTALDKYVPAPETGGATSAAAPTTQTASANPAPRSTFGEQILKYIVGLTGFFGLLLSILLSLMLLLLLNIMLIGRLIGISYVTSAFIWSLVIVVFAFPWQAFLNNQDLTRPEFRVPGVLYNWDELRHNADFEWADGVHINVMRWARFLVMPAVTVLLVFTVLAKSGKGLRMALGESSAVSAPRIKKKKEFDDDLADDTINDRNILT